ncbi:MAG: hypothetical protein ACYTGX_15855 [Planctomycetota bacterium]|jgi:ABC-type oligopeptide transport system substrate-binding subunit
MAALVVLGAAMAGCASGPAHAERIAKVKQPPERSHFRVVSSAKSKNRVSGRSVGNLFGKLIRLGSGVNKLVR